MQNIVKTHIILRDRDQRIGIALDPQSGLPQALLLRRGPDEVPLPLSMTAELVSGGREVIADPHGLNYVDTDHSTTFERIDTPLVYSVNGPQEVYTVATRSGDWNVTWHYTLRERHPYLELAFEIEPVQTAQSAQLLRNVHLSFHFSPPDLASWYVEAPGNQLRPGVTTDALQKAITISSIGSVDGSTGVVALHQPDHPQTVVLWPFSRTEIGELQLETREGELQFHVNTGLAGRLSPTERLRYDAIELDAVAESWEAVRAGFQAWYGPLGLSTPLDRAEWIKDASIFEVQIGYSVFWNGYQYSPYPTVRDLRADLGRIKGLGYTMLQIMPRQPYPSYNVHDYADITTSYGDEADLRILVQEAHALGMHVILDILLHGVIDQEVITATADRVRSGPYFARLNEQTTALFTDGSDGWSIPWSRHIIDFEPHWAGGSPYRHRLADEHPEWFMRDSAQNIIGIYTKAFDVANPGWQDYFSDAAVHLVQQLDIDGFRFDAPSYNDLPNWSTATARRASYSPLGSLALFDKLRVRLKQVKPSIMLYTEPSGVAFRQSMDVNYNYDEQWLIHAVLQPRPDERGQRTWVRNGRELAAWFRDRNAVLPAGALTAHHIDSHDTFWWPLQGKKWRREQHGLPATRAIMTVFALSGGAYMTFIGGEQEIEEEVKRVHRLRATQPEIGLGSANYDAVTVDHDAVYAVARQYGQDCSILLVNLSDQRLDTVCRIDDAALKLHESNYFIYDGWNDQALSNNGDYMIARAHLRQLPLHFDAYQTRLLSLKRASIEATTLS